MDEQPPARLLDGHVGRGTGLAAPRTGHRRGRSRAGVGQRRPRLLRRHRVQPDAAGERLHLAGPLQLAGRAGARLRVHDARLARGLEPAVHRQLRGQGAARRRPGGDEPARRQRLHVLDSLQREPDRELGLLRPLDGRRPDVLAAADLRHRRREPVLRHRRDAERRRVRRLAPVRRCPREPAAAERRRLRQVDERRPLLHAARRSGGVSALGPHRPLRRPGRRRAGLLRGVPRRRPNARPVPRPRASERRPRLRRRPVRVPVRICLPSPGEPGEDHRRPAGDRQPERRLRRLRRDGARNADADGHELRHAGRVRHRQPGRDLLHEDDERRSELDGPEPDRPADDGASVLRRRLRGIGRPPRCLAGQPQRLRERPALDPVGRRLPHGRDREPLDGGESAGRRQLRAGRSGLRHGGRGRRLRDVGGRRRDVDDGDRLHGADDAPVRAVRLPGRPVLRGLQLRRGLRLDRPHELDRPAGHAARHRSALPGGRRRRLRRPSTASTRRRAPTRARTTAASTRTSTASWPSRRNAEGPALAGPSPSIAPRRGVTSCRAYRPACRPRPAASRGPPRRRPRS